MSGKKEYIEIRGAKAHNLRGVNVDIPRDEFVVVTGLSGSGKSSLAFDTIYAEGQRRYLDTLSTYAKHFMGVLEKPDVESIEGLSPIIAIEQKTTGNNPRSTVGTITEIYDFLRLLYARASRAYSPVTGREMVRYTDEQIVDLIIDGYQGRKCCLLAPLVVGRKGHYRELFDQLRKRGYTEVRVDGEIRPLAETDAVDRYKAHFIELVVDKLKPSEGDRKRIRDSVMTALNLGKGSVAMLDISDSTVKHFSKHLIDPESGISLREPAPHSFSFNSPEGYCPHCKGLGMIVDVNIDSIIPDRSASIADGGIAPLGKLRQNKKFDILRSIARKYGFSLYDPIETIPDEAVSHIIFGSDELFRVGEGNLSEMVSWGGVVDDIDEKIVCPVCHGTRLNENARSFKIDGKTISDAAAMEMSELSERENRIARDILKELNDRVGFMLGVGLDYLSLDRATSSLSGGESQRIRLATQIGSKLVNVLYILDEPSIGLHQRDNLKLISSLKELRREGNSVMVVEHDMETMRNADWLVDVGPGAGEEGGRICLSAPLKAALAYGANPGKAPAGTDRETLRHCVFGKSLTLDYLMGRLTIPVPEKRRRGNGLTLGIRGARGNNLKDVDVDFPLGCFIGVAGVSGSGKSSLVNETLMPVLKNKFYRSKLKPLPHDSVEGTGNIDKLIEIDQKACNGAGFKVIEMNFLPSVNVVCDECRGRRYKEDTLAVRYKGKNINDVLEMPVSEAYEFFKPIPNIARKLKALVDVGLGYVHLGQSAVTLSGGESQRMKLAAELFRKATGNTLYILDEPTTGLHFEDIKILLGVLQQLVEQGNTVIIIEHNLDILKSVDYIIDLGPEGGSKGGTIVAKGTPEEVAANPDSVTGPYLLEALKG